jgi:hypothetical protein
MTSLIKKMGKKRCWHRKKLTQATKSVQYDKSMAPCLTYLIFSWRQRPPSWSKMLTSSWYHMIDVVLFFGFLKKERQLLTTKKSKKRFFLTPLPERIFFVIAKKIFPVSLRTKILHM